MNAADALLALRVLGLDYRPDVRVPAGQWVAVCPICAYFNGEKLGLVLRERVEGGPVSASCPDCEPDAVLDALRAALPPSPDRGLAREAEENVSTPPLREEPRPSPLTPSSRQGKKRATAGDSEDEGPEVERLLAKWRAGLREPVPVALPPLPDDPSPWVRLVAEFFALVWGLRLWAADDRPLPFALRWVAGNLGEGCTTRIVSRVLQKLVEAGVLVPAGSLPGRGGKRGTHLYVPGKARGSVVVKGRAGVVREADQPEVEVIDRPLVVGAELAIRDGTLDASGDGAGDEERVRAAVWSDHRESSRSDGSANATEPSGGTPAADEFVARLAEAFDAEETTSRGVAPYAVAGCKVARHRALGLDWSLDEEGSPIECGLCHPPADGLDVVRVRERRS